jgi:hypothetical protein
MMDDGLARPSAATRLTRHAPSPSRPPQASPPPYSSGRHGKPRAHTPIKVPTLNGTDRHA